MAVIDLGTNAVNIGGTPAQFNSFDFRDNRAYLIRATPTIEFPNQVFSQFQIRGIFNNNSYTETYTHHLLQYPVNPRPFVFLLPFSNCYGGNGDVILEVERISLSFGGGDASGSVTLNLTYDDDDDVRTWL